MAKLSYEQIRQQLNDLAAERAVGRQPFETKVYIESDDTWLGTWSHPQMYVLVQASLADPANNRTLIDVHAGGAYGLTPQAGLFETLSEATWRLDYGGAWSRRQAEKGVAFGWRSRYPSELLHRENCEEAFGFLMGMIWEFGRTAGQLADELIPRYGGRRCLDGDPDSWKALLSGVLPPQ